MSRKRFDRRCQFPARVAVQHQLFANHCEALLWVVLALGHLLFWLDHRQVGAGFLKTLFLFLKKGSTFASLPFLHDNYAHIGYGVVATISTLSASLSVPSDK
jgi:hypothetical protein